MPTDEYYTECLKAVRLVMREGAWEPINEADFVIRVFEYIQVQATVPILETAQAIYVTEWREALLDDEERVVPAHAELWRQLSKKAETRVYSHLKDAQDDIIQTTIQKIKNGLKHRDIKNFWAFAYTELYFTILDFDRAARRDREFSLDIPPDYPSELTDSIICDELWAQFFAQLREILINDLDQLIVIVSFLGGYKDEELLVHPVIQKYNEREDLKQGQPPNLERHKNRIHVKRTRGFQRLQNDPILQTLNDQLEAAHCQNPSDRIRNQFKSFYQVD
jgi:hypothetical protein